MSVDTQSMLRISELAERSGVSVATIKHYLREGLLGDDDDVLRTSRNMAYYPVQFVERVRLIKRLQEERFMPLKVIREVLDEDPERALRMIELRLARKIGPVLQDAESKAEYDHNSENSQGPASNGALLATSIGETQGKEESAVSLRSQFLFKHDSQKDRAIHPRRGETKAGCGRRVEAR